MLTEGSGKPSRLVAAIVRSLVHGEAMEPLAGAEALTRYIEAKRLERAALKRPVPEAAPYTTTGVTSINDWFQTVEERDAAA